MIVSGPVSMAKGCRPLTPKISAESGNNIRTKENANQSGGQLTFEQIGGDVSAGPKVSDVCDTNDHSKEPVDKLTQPSDGEPLDDLAIESRPRASKMSAESDDNVRTKENANKASDGLANEPIYGDASTRPSDSMSSGGNELMEIIGNKQSEQFNGRTNVNMAIGIGSLSHTWKMSGANCTVVRAKENVNKPDGQILNEIFGRTAVTCQEHLKRTECSVQKSTKPSICQPIAGEVVQNVSHKSKMSGISPEMAFGVHENVKQSAPEEKSEFKWSKLD